MTCRMIPKAICHKCGKGIFTRVEVVIDEGKIPYWDDDKKDWMNQKYYHLECKPLVLNTIDLNLRGK